MAVCKIMEVALRSATISQKVCTCWTFALIYSLKEQINLLLAPLGGLFAVQMLNMTKVSVQSIHSLQYYECVPRVWGNKEP